MRFEINNSPKSGDIRTIRCFLWFPRKVNNEIVWLESVIIKQKATRWYDMSCGCSGVRWEDEEMVLMK